MITPVQQRVYDFVKQYIDRHGYSPSLTEIAEGIGISPKSISLISRSVHALVAAGRFKFHKKGYRNIQVVEGSGTEADTSSGTSLPLVGQIVAHAPLAMFREEQHIDLKWLLQEGDHFLLEVKGDFMAAEGVLNGDLLVCRHAKKAQEGELVVAVVEGHDTVLSRLSYKIKDRITLIPANPAMKPKAYLPHGIDVKGVFVGLLRLGK